MATVDRRYVKIVCADPAITVTALLGEQPAAASGGYGGWSEVQRPRRKSLTVWDGIPPLKMDVQVILDGYRHRASVETDCVLIEQLAQPGTPGLEPPTVKLVGAVPHPEIDWVINDLDWDTTRIERDKATGLRLRQQVTLHLLEHVTADEIDRPSAAAAARAGSPAHRSYTVKAGDTLSSIAAHQPGGKASDWTQIADLNGIRDPKAIKAGQVIQLP